MKKSKIEMTKEQAIYCLKAGSERYPEICKDCELYGVTGTDHCWEDATYLAIKELTLSERQS